MRAVLWGALALLAASPAATVASALDFDANRIEFSRTRIVLDAGRGSSTLTLVNRGRDTVLLNTAMLEARTDGTADRDLCRLATVERPLKPLAAGDSEIVRVVLLDAPGEVESLCFLRARFIPKASPDSDTRVTSVLAALVKVFMRPEALRDVDPIERARSDLKLEKTENGRMALRNATPFWLTLDSLEVAGKPVLAPDARKPMLAPMTGRFEFDAPASSLVEARLLDDEGRPSTPLRWNTEQ